MELVICTSTFICIYLYMYLPKTSQIKGINLFYEHNKKKNSKKLILQIFQVVSTNVKTNQKVAFPRQQ